MCHMPDGKYPRGESHYGYFGFRNPATVYIPCFLISLIQRSRFAFFQCLRLAIALQTA